MLPVVVLVPVVFRPVLEVCRNRLILPITIHAAQTFNFLCPQLIFGETPILFLFYSLQLALDPPFPNVFAPRQCLPVLFVYLYFSQPLLGCT